MDAKTLLTYLTAYLDEGRHGNFYCRPQFYNPSHVGAFGAERTDRWTQAVMINDERFTVTVEKNQNK